MRLVFLFILFLNIFKLDAQIIIDNNIPFNNSTWLVDNILLGGGVVASNHSFQGDALQIGWFDASNTNLGIDSGIVLSTGDIYSLDPIIGGSFPILPNTVTDPDLLNVANSVPGLIGQTFSVSSVNDIAILEFDFIPTSDSLEFRYVFGSQEYFAWENTEYNDVFGFFLSGPGITGPYASPAIHPNGSINLAIVPNSNPPLPITISSVNSVTPINQQYFVDNQSGLTSIASAGAFTTVFTAKALVQCNETYHIRLAIADGSDVALDSYVWLEAGSFSSPSLDVVDNLGIDSVTMNIPCNSSIILTADGGDGASYQWFDSTSTVISIDSFIYAGPGVYWVEATSFGCPILSDTLEVLAQESPSFDFGPDYTIPCNTTTLLDPIVIGGLGNSFYTYNWSNGSTESSVMVGEGIYTLEVDDGTGCFYSDTITIVEQTRPIATVNGGGAICNDGSTVDITFNFNGLLPWNLVYMLNDSSQYVNNIFSNSYVLSTSMAGEYEIIYAEDINQCSSDSNGGTVNVIVNNLPEPVIKPSESIIYIGEEIILSTSVEYSYYEWYNNNDSLLGVQPNINVTDSGMFYVWVENAYGCSNFSSYASVMTTPLTQLYIPSVFTPNNDEHNELFVIHGENIAYFNIRVFNRWGELLFTSDSMSKYWDGTHNNQPVPQGIYSYSIDVIGKDGNSFKKNGVVNIMY